MLLREGHSLTRGRNWRLIIYPFVIMLKQFLVATAGAIAASLSPVAVVAAQSPPTIQLSGTEYVIDFKLGVFGDNIVELEAQPWYAVNDFTLAASAAGQVYNCAEGSPFTQPTCATSFDAFGNVSSGFGGLSPWFVYDVEAGVAATAVGFAGVTSGLNVLRQINTNLESEQPYAIVSTPPTEPATEAIPEPVSVAAIFLVGMAMARGLGRQQRG